MNSKIEEIKILVNGLLQDIEQLENSEKLQIYRFEDIMVAIDSIKHKLYTYKSEKDFGIIRELNDKLLDLAEYNIKTNLDNIVPEEVLNVVEVEEIEEENESHELQENIELSEVIETVEISEKLESVDEPQKEVDDVIFTDDSKNVDITAKVPNPIDEFLSNSIKNDDPFELFSVEKTSSKETYIEYPYEESLITEEDVLIEDTPFSNNENLESSSKTINDVSSISGPSWRRELPGSKIEDINDAISMNDRALFISELFKNDSEQFELTVERLNDMSNFEESVEYLRMAFPSWDEYSYTVYRFYMILRRKLDV